MGSVTKEMKSHKIYIHRGCTELPKFQLHTTERLFGHHYASEMRLPTGQLSTFWVKLLPDVVSALNNEVTRLTGKNLLMQSRTSRFSKTFHFLLKASWFKRKRAPF